MVDHTAYSQSNVVATLDGVQIQGLWDGDDPIQVEQVADVGTLLVGADGSSIFSQHADRAARITIQLMHTSPDHRRLIRYWKRQRAGELSGFAFNLVDNGSNEGGTADRCYIMTAPVDQKGRAASVRSWVLVTGDWEPNDTKEVQ